MQSVLDSALLLFPFGCCDHIQAGPLASSSNDVLHLTGTSMGNPRTTHMLVHWTSLLSSTSTPARSALLHVYRQCMFQKIDGKKLAVSQVANLVRWRDVTAWLHNVSADGLRGSSFPCATIVRCKWKPCLFALQRSSSYKPSSVSVCFALQVVHIDKPHGDQVPELPDADVNYHRDIAGDERPWRTDIKPLNVVQPEGPSFLVTSSFTMNA